jgi:leucyl-tRNA synthetase
LHQTIRKVSEDLPELRYNTAIAALMEYVNVLRSGEPATAAPPTALLDPLIVLLAPLAPHFAEECWERLGHRESVFDASWPSHDEGLAREEEVALVVQINGKVRARIMVPPGLDQEEAVQRALADAAVKKFVDGGGVKKTVYVPDRLVNLVV